MRPQTEISTASPAVGDDRRWRRWLVLPALAELSRRDLVPEIGLPDPGVRAERARWRLHLVHHRTMLKNRIHQTLVSFGYGGPVADLFGSQGRELLARLELPEPWVGNVTASLQLIDDLDRQIHQCATELRELGANHPYVPLLLTVLRPPDPAAVEFDVIVEPQQAGDLTA